MSDRSRSTHPWWDAPWAIWALLGVGALIAVGLFLVPGLLPKDQSARDARSAQIESQAVAAEARQDQAADKASARRAEQMN